MLKDKEMYNIVDQLRMLQKANSNPSFFTQTSDDYGLNSREVNPVTPLVQQSNFSSRFLHCELKFLNKVISMLRPQDEKGKEGRDSLCG